MILEPIASLRGARAAQRDNVRHIVDVPLGRHLRRPVRRRMRDAAAANEARASNAGERVEAIGVNSVSTDLPTKNTRPIVEDRFQADGAVVHMETARETASAARKCL